MSLRLHHASFHGNKKQVERILEEESVDVNESDSSGNTALHHACHEGKLEVVQYLLSQKNVMLDVANKEGSTPLHHAVFEGYIDIAKLLIQAGANVKAVDVDGSTPLHIACHQGNNPMISLLLIHGAEISKTDSTKNTPLHLAVLNQNDAESIRTLVNNKANVNAKNKNSHTPIHLAAYLGKENILEVLLKSKEADILVQDSQGYTALHLSILKKQVSTSKQLIKYMQENAKKTILTSNNGSTPLHVASYIGEPSILELLITSIKCDVNTVDNRGMSALHYAALANNYECVSLLLKHGAFSRLNNLSEQTPQDLTDDPTIAKMLSESKVDMESMSVDETETMSEMDDVRIENNKIDVKPITSEPVDKYGFSGRHPYVETPRDIEYNKQEVNRTAKWVKLLSRWKLNSKKYQKDKERIKRKVYRGIPDSVRGTVWTYFANVIDYKLKYPTSYFSELLKKPTPKANDIEKDLKRTFPTHVMFKEDLGQKSLNNVLHAFSLHNTSVGYCQGMGFVVALLLMYIPDEESAFWVLVHITENFEMGDMWSQNLFGLKRAYYRLEKLMEEHCPKVLNHMLNQNVTVNLISHQYFLTVFLYNCVWPCCLRIWDIFLYEGQPVIHATAIALFLLNEKEICKLEFENLIPYLKFSHQMDHQSLTEKISILVPAVKRRIPKLDKQYDKLKKKEELSQRKTN